jgi:hypothetical protein
MLRRSNNGFAIDPPAYRALGLLTSIAFLISLAITMGSELLASVPLKLFSAPLAMSL